jgi:hypothetical protein
MMRLCSLGGLVGRSRSESECGYWMMLLFSSNRQKLDLGHHLRKVSLDTRMRPSMTVTRSHARCESPFHQLCLDTLNHCPEMNP